MAEQKEQWKDVTGWRDHEVSSRGNIRRKHTADRMPGHEAAQHDKRDGYRYVVFRRYVHSVVAEAFHGPPPRGQVVNHKDGNKANNCAENLEWVTSSGNGVHAVESGLQGRGEDHGRAKLTNAQVLEIRERYKGQWGAQTALAKEFGVSQGLISQIVKGEAWAHLPIGECEVSGKRPRGEDHHNATVTATVVRELRALFAVGNVTHQQLAQKYGVSPTTVSRIVRWKTWRHVT